MWNISRLWKKYDKKSNGEEETYISPNDFPTEDVSCFLNEHSPREKTPTECPIRLWPHQEAMLHRIRSIETNNRVCKTEYTDAVRYMDKSVIEHPPHVCVGIMNDPPGSGKTYAILTAILVDTVGVSVIIVPQNIYGQWRSSMEVIFQDHLEMCKFSHSYKDIIDLYGNPTKIQEYKVILLQDSFAEAFLKVVNDKKIRVRRVVIDEIDIMDKFVCSSIQTDYVWLMSASYKDQKRLGPYFIEQYEDVICKCDPSFVKQSLMLPEPVVTVHECDDEHIQLFDGILEKKQMNLLHAGDFRSLHRIMNVSGGTIITPYVMNDIANKYSDYLLKKTNELDELRTMLLSTTYSDEDSQKEYSIIKKSISQLETYQKHAEIIKDRLLTLPDMQTKCVKEKFLEEEYVKEMTENKDSKWLIFNDNGNTLIHYQNFLNSKEIKTTMLDGGNQKRIEKALEDYKKGDTQVLLLNSMIEGAGMNLENTTHLLFMHKTEEKFIDQVIGRAQRFGRSVPLQIIMLCNIHE